MIDFWTWMETKLNEKGMRTALGPYPEIYGAGSYPPSYFTPIAADAAVKLKMYHSKDLEMKPVRKKKKSKKKGKKKK